MITPERLQPIVHIDEHFVVEACSTCFIPGYLIVRPRQAVVSLSLMSPSVLKVLGSTLALTTQAIETVVQPERVYCALFSEQTRSVHFHLFPRTAWLTANYVAAHPHDPELSGPLLMDRARRVFQQPISDVDATEALQKIRDWWRLTDVLFAAKQPPA